MPFPSCLPNLNRNGVPDRPVSRIHRMEMIVNRSSALEVLVAAVFLTGLFYFGVRYDVQNTLRQILTWIRGLGGDWSPGFRCHLCPGRRGSSARVDPDHGGHCHVNIVSG